MSEKTIGYAFLWLIIIAFYFFPTFVGYDKKNGVAIFTLNLLLGWTVLGWIIALVWALTYEKNDKGDEMG